MTGMDGFELLRKLANDGETSRIPAIVYTGSRRSDELREFVAKHESYSFLLKPAPPEEIVKLVQSALGGGGNAAPAMKAISGARGTSRLALLIEILQDLTEEHDPAGLSIAFCRAMNLVVGAYGSFVYFVPNGAANTSPLFSVESARERRIEDADPRLRTALAPVMEGHGIVRFANFDLQDWGLPSGLEGSVSLLCVPIFTATCDYGCTGLMRSIAVDDFNDEDERLALTLTSHLAALYENAVLFKRTVALAARLANEVEERKRAEEELDRSRKEQIRLKDEFFSHVSHELRSPVMAAQQFLEIL
jgi:hypothetical protein